MAARANDEAAEDAAVPTPEELLDRARALVPALTERAGETEQRRSLPAETVSDLQSAGLLRILQPPHLGGFGLDIRAHLAVAAELARGCASAAWIQTLAGYQNMLVGFFDPRAQAEVLEAGAPLLAALVTGPSVTAELADGGVRLAGTWPYVSAADHCNWLMLSGHDPDARRDGKWRVITCLLPRSSAAVVDDWFSLGLRGTGSKSVTLDGEFIPQHRIICLQETAGTGTPGQAVNPGPLFRGIPTSTLFAMVITAPALGIAQAAVDAYRDRLRTRWNARMRSAQTEWPASQMRLGRVVPRLKAARLAFTASTDAFMAGIEGGGEITVEQRTGYRMDMVEVVRICTEIVYELFLDAGTGATMDGAPLQRHFRDIHTLCSHFVLGPDAAAENLGRVQLGQAPKPPFI